MSRLSFHNCIWRAHFFILLFGCFNAYAESRPDHQDDKVLRIGVIQSLTGIVAEDGNTALKALRLAARDFENKEGMRVDLLIEDDATFPVKSVSAYRNLRAKGVDAIIGPTWSFTTNPVLPLAGLDRIVLINSTTPPECLNLNDASGYGFTTAASVWTHAHVFKEYVIDKNFQSAVLFFTNNTWGEAQRNAYRKVLEETGTAILEEIESAGFDTNEWRAL